MNIILFVFIVTLTTSKSTREANRDQASSIAGTASATVSAKPGKTKKRSRKEILLSDDDESTAGQKTLTIQMQHSISKSSTSEGGNSIVEAVKSLNEELRSRKDLIIQLQELEDPSYTAEILSNKKRIIEVRPIFPLIRSFWLFIITITDFP